MIGVSKVSEWLFGMVNSPELNRYAASWSTPWAPIEIGLGLELLRNGVEGSEKLLDGAGGIRAEDDAAVVLDVVDVEAHIEHAEAAKADQDVAAEGDGAGGVLDIDVAGAGAGVGDVEIAHDGGVGAVEDGEFAGAGVADRDGAGGDQVGTGAGDGDDAGAAGPDACIERGRANSGPVGDGKHAGCGVADIESAGDLPVGARTGHVPGGAPGAGLVGDDGGVADDSTVRLDRQIADPVVADDQVARATPRRIRSGDGDRGGHAT